MGDFAGFLVLSAFPLALLVILVVGILAVGVAVRTQNTPRRKGIAAAVATTIVVLIPTWDIILGRAQFNYLCATNSGIRVHKRVQLGPEYRDIHFPSVSVEYRRLPFAKEYPYRFASNPDVFGPAVIEMTRYVITEAKTGEVIGSSTDYVYRGGWFENIFGIGGGICSQSFNELLEQIFERSS
jgi:hypothetical protein